MNFHELTSRAAQVERFLKAMANSHRLMILCELHKGETSVTPLQQTIGVSQSSLSQHLAKLRADDLVTTRRASQTIYYSLADKKVSRVIALLHVMFCNEKYEAPKRNPRRGDGGEDAAIAAKKPRRQTSKVKARSKDALPFTVARHCGLGQ